MPAGSGPGDFTTLSVLRSFKLLQFVKKWEVDLQYTQGYRILGCGRLPAAVYLCGDRFSAPWRMVADGNLGLWLISFLWLWGYLKAVGLSYYCLAFCLSFEPCSEVHKVVVSIRGG